MSETNKKVPKVRFPGFTDDWEQRKFGELCSIVTKQTGFDYTATIKNSLVTKPSKDTLPYLQTKNFTGINVDYETDYYIPKTVAKEFPKINLDEKCLLFSIVGASVGNIGLFPGDKHCFLSGAICVSKFLNQDDADFLYHYMSSEYGQRQIRTCTKGGAQATITIEDIRDFNVLFPSKEERMIIGEFLTKIDNIIALHQKELTNLETQKKAVMKKIFSQEVRFKKADGSDFPEWEETRFGDTVTIERGGSPRPIERYITDDDGLNWVKIGDAPKYGNYITSTAQRIIPEGLRKTRQVFVGDLILSNSMSFGKPYIMGIDGCIHDGWLLIRNDQERYNLIYLCFLLGSDYMLKQYKSLAGGSTVNNLNKDLVAGTIVFIPCLEEQRLIADFLSDFDEAIAAAKKELELWKELKKGLLQQMFV